MSRKDVYTALVKQMKVVLDGETNIISILSTVAGLLKQSDTSFYWVGFYLEDEGVLKVGPYQGTLGCLTIAHTRGVCGRAYRLKEAQLVDDVHADSEHIACDPASLSEIVVPLILGDGSVYGVLDIDSNLAGNFDAIDQYYLEMIVKELIEPFL